MYAALLVPAERRTLCYDRATALAGYRDVRHRFNDLGLGWDVAFIALPAATVLGADDAEVAGWLGDARGAFERMRAGPMIALVDGLLASSGGGPGASNGWRPGSTGSLPAPASVGDPRTQAEASSSST